MATILVLDDNLDAINLISRVVRMWGHKPLTALTGEAGLALLGAERIDLVIVDGMMPGMNGIEFIRLMRADPLTEVIPAVLFTAVTDGHFHMNAIAGGADECWVKGDTDYGGMRERVNALLGEKWQAVEEFRQAISEEAEQRRLHPDRFRD